MLAAHLSDAARAGWTATSTSSLRPHPDAGWAEAVAGCRFVLHVASPFPDTPPKDEREVIDPATRGRTPGAAGGGGAGVERVVLTSSVAAIAYGRTADHVFTEADWSRRRRQGDRRLREVQDARRARGLGRTWTPTPTPPPPWW